MPWLALLENIHTLLLEIGHFQGRGSPKARMFSAKV